MWKSGVNSMPMGFSTPPSTKNFICTHNSVMKNSMSEGKCLRSPGIKCDLFHVIHKVPAGDSPYVKAKQVQLIDKDPAKAISLFWSAINSGDRVDSALKDMAIVMKQLNRSDEAIEAIKSFRHLCPYDSQESIDNVLIELYKRAGRTEEEIEMLQFKLKRLEDGTAFGGRRTKTARSQGKKVHITIEEEKSRILGNLAWAFLQQKNYRIAEEHYRKALLLEPDRNKECNLAICLMHMNRMKEARSLLEAVKAASGNKLMDESYAKSFERAYEMLTDREQQQSASNPIGKEESSCIESSRSLPLPAKANHSIITTQSHNQLGKDSFKYGSTNSPSTSFRLTNPHSQQGRLYRWKRDHFEEVSGERKSGSSPREELWFGKNRTKASASSYEKIHLSQASGRCSLKAPLAAHSRRNLLAEQSRRNLWGFNDTSQRTEGCENDGYNSSNKFADDQSITRSMQAHRVQEDCASEHILNEDWRRKSITTENHDLKKSANKESNLIPKFRTENFTCGEWDGSSEATDVGRSGPIKTNTLMGEWFIEKTSIDLDNINQLVTVSSQPKKSWADMVEEEEGLELLSGGKTEYLDSWNNEEEVEYNDENLNSNIMPASIFWHTYTETLSQDLEEQCDLKDGYDTSNTIVSSRNPNVKRCLDYDLPREDEPKDYLCSSSFAAMPKKIVNFVNSNSVKTMARTPIRRLQVFKDITP